MEIPQSARDLVRNPLGAASDAAFQAKVLHDVGILRPSGPRQLARSLQTLARWGTSPGALTQLAAIRDPDAVAVSDEIGELTFRDLDDRSNALASSLAERGVGPGDGIGIMIRNHRGFIDATSAAAKLGASILFLNTAFAGRQLVEVMEREGPEVLIYDHEFEGLLEGLPGSITKVVSWHEEEVPDADASEMLIEGGDRAARTRPDQDARFVILTSGTTGTPKGAQRSNTTGLGNATALMDRIPYRRGDKMMIAAPMFHSWGFMHMVIAIGTSHTIILRRKFDPEETLRATAESGAQVLAVVPVMMQRILELPDETLRSFDLSALRITAVSGSALPGEMATRWMDLFGDNVYNLYGSTEVAIATIASPQDLRAAPGTAGRPPRNTVVKIYDPDGEELPAGETGRIFVGSDIPFEGYTGGGSKESIDGLLSSGDVGYFDEEGRLHVSGRDDEMIVSGGENVFPREVEDLLSEHDDVAEVAVIGVDDDEFGQRLKAFVVTRDSGDPSEDDLKGYVKQNLANYKTPREVVFLEELPRNATGKVLKRELVEGEDGDDDQDAGGGGDQDAGGDE